MLFGSQETVTFYGKVDENIDILVLIKLDN